MDYLKQLETLLSILESAYELMPALKAAAYSDSYVINDHITLNNEANMLQAQILDLLASVQEAADAHSQRMH